MIEEYREPITSDEAAWLNRVARRGLFLRLVSDPKNRPHQESGEKFADVYEVAVERCFIPIDFNEEFPLYLLDLGGKLLILFGQWLFDPHTLIVPANIFESWICDQNFFSRFSLRCFSETGSAFELKVEGRSFIPAERLPIPLRFKSLRECQLLLGQGETLIHDLQNANLIAGNQ